MIDLLATHLQQFIREVKMFKRELYKSITTKTSTRNLALG